MHKISSTNHRSSRSWLRYAIDTARVRPRGSALAAEVDTPYLAAMAAQATGSVLLAGGEPGPALAPLRSAWTAWQTLQVPYETARCRVLHALACRELGDADGARMQLAAARAGFGRLGVI